jgi:hypothetical protein
VGTLFDTVEWLFTGRLSGDAENLLVVGFLEGLQNRTTDTRCPVSSSQFLPLLGPRTRRRWDELHRWWGTTDRRP